ncbi:amino-transferase class IV domain-containing protein [Ditylenchus destructor]|uniref:Branched-chain-amino-acid aminotransferase n=1 Tax=Ditylenchus destructor TaxID=166010 RepID=A0AAD4MQY1_9BILA|nr:amino-transferase class IV domain-containing protein [Ditylenchus destructor]
MIGDIRRARTHPKFKHRFALRVQINLLLFARNPCISNVVTRCGSGRCSASKGVVNIHRFENTSPWHYSTIIGLLQILSPKMHCKNINALLITISKSNISEIFKDLQVQEASPEQRQPKPSGSDVKFGRVFSDHMLEVDWTEDNGWGIPHITPLHNLSIHPGSQVLHYAIELFEGMKAFRGFDNKIRLFRPDVNMERMRRTAKRAALPDFNGDELLKIIMKLIDLDREWVPYPENTSLYVRPTFIGTDPALALDTTRQAKLFVVTSPMGTYYSSEKGICLMADSDYVRSFPGGVGAYKLGSNYGPTIMVSELAEELGCDQVLWLFGQDEKLTEVGTTNIFIYWINENGEKELTTPPLSDGLILPGVTRDSLLAIARGWNEFKVVERYPTMAQVKQAVAENRLLQMFASGTAVGVSPVDRILYRNPSTGEFEEILIATTVTDCAVMQRLHHALLDIQYGRIDAHEWTKIIE